MYICTALKHLLEFSPVPKIPTAFSKGMKQGATVLTSRVWLNRRKAADETIRTRNVSGLRGPQTEAKRKKILEESSEQEIDVYGRKICCKC
jgi:hypothetical protein